MQIQRTIIPAAYLQQSPARGSQRAQTSAPKVVSAPGATGASSSPVIESDPGSLSTQLLHFQETIEDMFRARLQSSSRGRLAGMANSK